MRIAFDVLNGAETAEFVILALVSARLWWRQRGATHAWLAGTFGALGLVVTVGRLIPSHPHGLAEGIGVRVLIMLIALFPYCLYRFTMTFRSERPRSWPIALSATAVLCVWSLALPSIPQPGQQRSTGFLLFLVAFLAQWTGLLVIVAASLWNGAKREPTVARRRMRTLALAAVGMAVALLISGTASNSNQVHPEQIVVAALIIAIMPLFLIGVAPPAIVLLSWRSDDQTSMREATIGLVRAATPTEICDALLPRVTQFIGGHGAAILTSNGLVLGSYHLDEAGLAPLRAKAEATEAVDGVVIADGVLWLPLSTGWLVMVTTAFTPFFGQEETKVLLAIGVLTDMALSRVELLERDREHVETMRDFVSIASHDLRTPTAAIVGYAAMLERKWEKLSDEQKLHMISAMNRQSSHLGRLVEDLLTASRLDAAAMPVDASLVNVSNLVEEVVRDLNMMKVEVSVPGDLGVLIDPEHLRRIITNYIRNAQVYGGDPIRVTGTVDSGRVMISVSDCGAGVPEDFRPRLFEKFARADKKTSTATGGTGLGLSIVQGLAAAAGGTAWYEPREPHGSVFGVTLPVPVPQQHAKEDRWTSSGSSSSSRTRQTSAG